MRRPLSLFVSVAIICALVAQGAALVAARPLATTVEYRVNASADDAEELADTTMDLSSTNFDLIQSGGNLAGMRFTGVAVPAGSTITAAYIEFYANANRSAAASLTIYGEANTNPGAFGAGNGDMSARTSTAATVAWSPGAWTADVTYQSASISSIIQELVDAGGWSSGQAMVVIIDGSGDRRAWSYDGWAARAPLLHIEYDVATPTPTATATPTDTPTATATPTNTATATPTVTGTPATATPTPIAPPGEGAEWLNIQDIFAMFLGPWLIIYGGIALAGSVAMALIGVLWRRPVRARIIIRSDDD